MSAQEMRFLPLTPERWDDFEELFGECGAYEGCWCMWWRLTRREWHRQRGEGNRQAMKQIVEVGGVPGIMAYVDGRAAGWCSIGPREVFPSLNRSRNLRRIDAEPVWSIVCFYVDPAYRGSGLMSALLAAARDYALSQGARVVEAYPREPDAISEPMMAYMGIVPAFKKAGFKEVARRTQRQPVMRWRRP
jgi:GNAT superfamily N-acetyltransferase